MSRHLLPLGALALLLAAAGAASAQGVRNETAAQNRRESDQYERLVCSNAAFRARRVQQECGPIADPALRQSCVASFDCGKGQGSGQRSDRGGGQWRQAPPSERIR